MNHKRKKAKHQRAGCIFCKPHKDNRNGNAIKELSRTHKQEAKGRLELKEQTS